MESDNLSVDLLADEKQRRKEKMLDIKSQNETFMIISQYESPS